MKLRNKVERFEDWQRREAARPLQPVERMSDEELLEIIACACGVSPVEVTDELLQTIAGG